MSYQSELEIAISSVIKTCGLCTNAQNSFVKSDTVAKKDKSPVTIADLGGQAVITNEIRKKFPDDHIIAEEDASTIIENADIKSKVLSLVNGCLSEEFDDNRLIETLTNQSHASDGSKRFWTIDPIDGTKGFLRKEQYAIALALIEDGQVVLGVLGCPNYPIKNNNIDKGCLFYATKGGGTFVQYIDNSQSNKISVDCVENSSDARFCESVESGHSSHDVHAKISENLGITNEPYRIDSQCKYAAVAQGDASIYLRLARGTTYKEKIWDHAAGLIVVEEAGGKVTDMKGRELDFTQGRCLENNLGIIATNGKLHSQVLEAVSQVI